MCCGALSTGSRSKFNEDVYTWLTMGRLDFSVGFLVDSLTAMMMVVVTSVLADGAHLHHRLYAR